MNLLVVAGLLAALVGPLRGAPGTGVYRDLDAGPHVVYLVGHAGNGFAPLYRAWRAGELHSGRLAWFRGYRYRLERIVLVDRLAPGASSWLLSGPPGTTSLRLQFCASTTSSARVVVLDFVRW